MWQNSWRYGGRLAPPGLPAPKHSTWHEKSFRNLLTPDWMSSSHTQSLVWPVSQGVQDESSPLSLLFIHEYSCTIHHIPEDLGTFSRQNFNYLTPSV
ncbi:hypothetical protein AGOR_G00222810 [Albula goreensis]|uniref:Uncharacterized protein n=1 Tax=Albula goreensis TaxID=1534307 RepID=A0A8T3CJD9_9TELE|nr:hypothetical protein AGOR_G00222810 [Albula goreensis]